MRFFHKTYVCERCGKNLNRRSRVIFDSTHQGRYKDGAINYVCQDCLLEMFYHNLREFNGYAVVFTPINGYNAYVTYNFDHLMNIKQTHKVAIENQKFIQDLNSLLPISNTTCNDCHNLAKYSWCSSQIINDNPYSWNINEDIKVNPIYLCKECLIRRFQQEIDNNNIKFDAIYPPLNGNGFLCSWDI